MKDLSKANNPYNDEKVISQCSIFGMMDTSGKCHSGEKVITAKGGGVVIGSKPIEGKVLVELESGARIELPLEEVTTRYKVKGEKRGKSKNIEKGS